MAPLIPGWVVLEDPVIILSICMLMSSSYVDLLPHRNNLWPLDHHRHISTPLPLQLGLGEELGLEGGRNNVGIVAAMLVCDK